MKQYEKWAQGFVGPLSTAFDRMPYRPRILDLLEKAYIAGFFKGREMAARLWANGDKHSFSDFTALGESEVE